MPADYTSLQTRATALLTASGEAVTLGHTSGATTDPVTGAQTGGVTTESNAHIVFDKGSAQYVARMGGAFVAGKHVVGYCTAEVTPVPGDIITRASGEKFRVVVVEPTSPAGIDLMHTLMLER